MKRSFFLIAITAVILMGCGNKKTVEKTTEPRVKVSTAKVLSVKNAHNFRYSGTIEASQTIPLTFKTPGIVERIYVEVGDQVKKGQLLATIDNSDMQNVHNTMVAKYEQAQDAYNRLKSVYDQGSLPEIKWVEMQSNLEQAKSAYELSKNNLEKCNLLAPVGGLIGSRNIEPGQSSLSFSQSAIEIVKIETVYVKIAVPENEISKIKKGLKSKITVLALNEKHFDGVVSNVSPVADAISRTYTVKILVTNTGYDLKPGMVCDVLLNPDSETSALVVPYKAVSKGSKGEPYVFVVTPSNTVKKQTITVGRYCEEGIVVLTGLTEGQIIVSQGCEKLSDNTLIQL